MELRHVRYFLAAAENRSISKASRRLHVSQPAVSRQIRDLEEELGVRLFLRERSGLRLTAAGERLLGYARSIVGLADEAAAAMRELGHDRPPLAIGFLTTSPCSFLGQGLKSFRERHPEQRFTIFEMSPAEQVEALRDGRIDIALIGNPCAAVHEEFVTRELFTMPLKAFVPSAHRLAGRPSIPLKELEREAFVVLAETSFPGRVQAVVSLCRAAGFSPNLSCEARSIMEVLTMIGAGSGVALMPSDVSCVGGVDVVAVEIEDRIEPIRFTAAWRRTGSHPVIPGFIDVLEHGHPG